MKAQNIEKDQKYEEIKEKNHILKKQAEIMTKLLSNENNILQNTQEKFITIEELNEMIHIKFLSQSEIIDTSVVQFESCKGQYFVIKKFKSTSFKHFKQFFREFDTISSINQQCIVKFHRYINSMIDIPNPLLFVEYLSYTLKDKFEDKSLSFKITNAQLVSIIVDIAVGLRYLHEDKQVMHRNLKPENILITKKYHGKIGDFCWANIINADLIYSQKDSKSISYMTPELLNSDEYKEKVDQYSFGKLIYYIISEVKILPSIQMKLKIEYASKIFLHFLILHQKL